MSGSTFIGVVFSNNVPQVSPRPKEEHRRVSGLDDNSSAISDTMSMMMDAQKASNVRMLPMDGQIEGSEDHQGLGILLCRLL